MTSPFVAGLDNAFYADLKQVCAAYSGVRKTSCHARAKTSCHARAKTSCHARAKTSCDATAWTYYQTVDKLG